MPSFGMLCHVALARTDVSEKFSASIIRVTRQGDKFLQEPYGITCQKTAFFIVTVVKTSNLTKAFLSVGEVQSQRLPCQCSPIYLVFVARMEELWSVLCVATTDLSGYSSRMCR
jgi:hypothetical protein